MAIIKALPAQTLTFKTSDQLEEGDFVVLSGDMTVSKAQAGAEALGCVVVASEMGLVSILSNKPVVELVAGGAIAAGDNVEVGASGIVKVETGSKVGVALKSAEAGQKTWVALALG